MGYLARLGQDEGWLVIFDRRENAPELGDTHAKILISDTRFAVSTSFNWLSFKGERDRTFRDERGTLVSDPQKIDELFDNLLRRLTEES